MPPLSAALLIAALTAAPLAAIAAQPGAMSGQAPSNAGAASAPDALGDQEAAPLDRRADGARPPGVYRGPPVTPPRAGRPDMPRPRGPGSPAELARALRLRSDQAPALRDYLGATLPTADDRRREEDGVRRLAAMTTPQRLDFTAQELSRGEADFARRAEAIRRFYGQLTPDQQRRFDQITGPPPPGGSDAREDGSDPR